MAGEYAGTALNLQWIYSGGTVTLSGRYRTFSKSDSITTYPVDAAADTDMTYIRGIKDRTLNVGVLAVADGTATYDALAAGTYGTLLVSPEGTATGKRKESYPAYSLGVNVTEPYNNAVEWSIDFQGNGAPTHTAW